MTIPKPDLRDPEYVAYAHLSNDVMRGVPFGIFVDLGTREAIAEHLWDLGYRKTPQNGPETAPGAPGSTFRDSQDGDDEMRRAGRIFPDHVYEGVAKAFDRTMKEDGK